MIGLGTIISLVIAFYIVILLHELGHRPTKGIKWYWGWIPSASATAAKSRIGGLVVNVLLFIFIYYIQPDNIILQYVGLISWMHFILYAIFGSLLPEAPDWLVNIDNYVFDDVPNEHATFYIGAAIISFLMFASYYLPMMKELIL